MGAFSIFQTFDNLVSEKWLAVEGNGRKLGLGGKYVMYTG